MADSDEEIERAPTPGAASYEQTLDPELLMFYNSYGSSSQVQDQKPRVPVRRGTISFFCSAKLLRSRMAITVAKAVPSSRERRELHY